MRNTSQSFVFGFDSQLHVLFLFFVSHKMFSDDSKKPTAGTELVLAKEGNFGQLLKLKLSGSV